MTTESSKNGAITLSRVNFSGHVRHATILSWMLTTACCLVLGRISFKTIDSSTHNTTTSILQHRIDRKIAVCYTHQFNC